MALRENAHNANAIDAFEVTTFLRLALNELIEALAATLLHTFETDNEIDRKWELVLVVVLEHIEPSQNRTLVI